MGRNGFKLIDSNNRMNKTIAILAATVCLLYLSSANAQNLIANGDFSSGLTGWTLQPGGVVQTTITYTNGVGNPPGSALLDRVSTALADNSDYLYQVIPVENGKSYQFNAEWKGDLLNGGTGRNWAEVLIAFVSNPGTPAFTIMYKKATAGGPNEPTAPWDWESVLASPNDTVSPTNGIFTATDNYMVVGFNLGGRAGTGVGYYYADNVSVTPYPPTPPPSAPVFTNVMRAGGDLILQGGNGPTNGAYEMLRSPEVTAPMNNWVGIGIKSFDLNGNFSFTNALPADPANFYRLLVVSSVPVYPPGITAQPQDLAVAVGANAEFNVTAAGTAPLTYRWYFNTNTLLASGPGATLSIPNAQLTNSGKISVTVSNFLDVAHSVFAMLTVTNSATPPFITSQPTNRAVIVGQTANFSVTATGTAPLRYQWYFNTNTLLLNETNTTLTLNNVQLTNAGQYSVTVTNLFGTTNSAFATLTVNSNASPELIGWAAVAGYGQTTTTGGGTNTPILVTDVATLRTLAGDSTPRVIELSGTFVTGSSAITIANNKTLRGVDANVIIQGGIDINTRSNIIIRNLSILGNGQLTTTNSDGSGILPVDAAAIRNSHHLWFDHLNIADGPDGNLDLTVGTDLVTVSWCKFWYTTPTRAHRLSCLIGNGSTATTDTNKNNVTYHHNWFAQGVQERMPRILFGKSHVFNNYYNSTNNNYCVGVGSFASVLIENNYFQGVKDCYKFADGNPAYITANNNLTVGTSGLLQTGLGNPTGTAFDPLPFTNPPYSYTLDAAASVPSMVTAGAGPS
jgi:pectate lyase